MTVTIDLANDENDDWLKKANPDYRKSEAKAHAGAVKLHEADVAKAEKEIGDYQVQLPEFAPDPWPAQVVVEQLAEQVVTAGLSWPEAIARFKATHQLIGDEWVPNA